MTPAELTAIWQLAVVSIGACALMIAVAYLLNRAGRDR